MPESRTSTPCSRPPTGRKATRGFRRSWSQPTRRGSGSSGPSCSRRRTRSVRSSSSTAGSRPRAGWAPTATVRTRARRIPADPRELARMATDLTAARLLTYRAAWEKDRGAERVTLEAAMAKAFATEAAQRIVDDAVQILGGRGVLASHPVDRLYRAVRALRIYEGTTEIQHLIVAGQLLKQAGGAA